MQDTLRGRPAFAIAANLPRRGGLTQLNHLVAALFAQGIPIRPEFLYARRRPRLIEWHSPEKPARTQLAIKLDVPASRLSEPTTLRHSLESRLHAESDDTGPHEAGTPIGLTATALLESRLQAEPNHADWMKPGLQQQRWNGDSPGFPGLESAFSDHTAGFDVCSEIDATMLAFQETMRAFLETQQAVIGAYLGSHTDRWNGRSTTTSGPEPGPWVGEIRRLIPGSEVEAAYLLDAGTTRSPITTRWVVGEYRRWTRRARDCRSCHSP